MNVLSRFLSAMPVLFLAGALATAQPTWHYRGVLSFDAVDSVVSPLLCATDAAGNLWVISSTNVSAVAHNALFKKTPSDTMLRLVEDYTTLADPNVTSTRGIATHGNDVYVSHNKGTTGTAAVFYVYRDGDPAKRVAYGSGLGHAGYGTFVFGISVTSDTVVIGGLSFGTSFRMWNYNSSIVAAGYASYIPPASNAVEPGGANDAGVDIIRDVATVPSGDYDDSKTVFYTSRNSSTTHPTAGGIALWIGGTQTTPASYRPKRVTDFFADLSLGRSVPYGISVDGEGHVYVAGTDTLRRWVRGYAVDTSGNATSWAELPSATDASNPNPAGAPFETPSDVAFSPDHTMAYVTDLGTRKVYWFATTPATSVDDGRTGPIGFDLGQNYPNPFNPSTQIRLHMIRTEHATLRVYDLLGRPVATLIDRELSAGQHLVEFNASAHQLPSGVYVYRLTTSAGTLARKMVLSQ